MPHRLAALRSYLRRRYPPIVRQQEAADCGPAALLSVLRFWGGDESVSVVRDLCRTDSSGSTLLGLRDAAEALGFRARGARGELSDLVEEPLPCIAHLVLPSGQAHFVVVSRVSTKRVWIVDPKRGRHSQTRIDFEEAWKTRSALLLSPSERLRRSPTTGWVRWMLAHLRREPVWVTQSLFLGCVATGLGLLTAAFVKWLIDRFIPERDTHMILATGAALLCVLLAGAFCRYLRNVFLVRLNQDVGTRINEDFLGHLYRLPIQFFESRATGDITSRIGDGVRVQQGILHGAGVAIVDGFLVLGSCLCLLWISPPLGILAATTMPLYLAGLLCAGRTLRKEQAASLSSYGRLESGYIDSIRGVSELLAFDAAGFFARTNGTLYRTFAERVSRLGRVQAGLGLFSELAGGVLIVSALTWGALLVVSEEMQLGQLVAGYSLLASIVPASERITRAWVGLQETAASAERFRDLALTPAQERGGSLQCPEAKWQELRTESVTYRWPTGECQLLNLHLSLVRGEIVGLSGMNGSGKSTLVRILNRSLEPSAGRLLVNEDPALDVPLDAYRCKVALLQSGTYLFAGTVADNVFLGRFGRDPSSVIAHLEALGFSTLVGRFARGWHSIVGEGGRRLSTGERQAIGLMRALAARPAFLLVDEGLEGTDSEMKQLMMAVLTQHKKHGGVLLISHDRWVLDHSDRVLELVDGQVQQPRASNGLSGLPGCPA